MELLLVLMYQGNEELRVWPKDTADVCSNKGRKIAVTVTRNSHWTKKIRKFDQNEIWIYSAHFWLKINCGLFFFSSYSLVIKINGQ